MAARNLSRDIFQEKNLPDRKQASGIVDEVEEGHRGKWRYKLTPHKLIPHMDSDHEWFYEDELETTGQFD